MSPVSMSREIVKASTSSRSFARGGHAEGRDGLHGGGEGSGGRDSGVRGGRTGLDHASMECAGVLGTSVASDGNQSDTPIDRRQIYGQTSVSLLKSPHRVFGESKMGAEGSARSDALDFPHSPPNSHSLPLSSFRPSTPQQDSASLSSDQDRTSPSSAFRSPRGDPLSPKQDKRHSKRRRDEREEGGREEKDNNAQASQGLGIEVVFFCP